MKLYITILFSALLLTLPRAAFCDPASGQKGKGSLTGRIINQQGVPVAGVTVTIKGQYLGGYTDDQGHYRIDNIPAGEQELLVSGVAIEQTGATAVVVPGRQTEVPDIAVDDLHTLEEVTVVGKSEARRQQEQAYAVSVIDVKKNFNLSTDLAGLINKASGVRIREDGGMGSGYSFSLNGFSGRQVKVFIDGMPMENFGAAYGLNNLPSNMVERVEVYKGVLPVGLGADALGGAVNIISRKSADYLDVSYSYGSFNTNRASINGSFTDKSTGFTARLNTFGNYSDNDYRVLVPIINLETNEKGPEQWVRRFHDRYKSAGGRFEMGLADRSWADYLLAGVVVAGYDKQIQNGVVMDLVYGGRTTYGSSLIPSLRYGKKDLFVDGLGLTLYAAYSDVEQHNIDTLARRYNWLGDWAASDIAAERSRSQARIDSREWSGNGNLDYTFNNHHTLTLNYVFTDLRRTASDVEDPANDTNKIPQTIAKQIAGLGWMAKYERWNSTLFSKMYRMRAGSYQAVSGGDPLPLSQTYQEYGYGAAVTYFVLRGLQLKLSGEKTYRLPEASEMFGDGQEYSRNADLKPESSYNLNTGLMAELHSPDRKHTFNFEVSYLYRDSRDFIQKELRQPSMRSINLGKVRTQCVEAGVNYAWTGGLHAGGNVTWQDIRDNRKMVASPTIGAPDIENFNYRARLPNVPYLFGNANAGWSRRNVLMQNTLLTLDYYFTYVHEYFLSWPGLGAASSKEVIPGQAAHSVALGYNLKGGRYNFTFECNNLTGERLYDNYRLQKPGRSFTVKFRYFIGK